MPGTLWIPGTRQEAMAQAAAEEHRDMLEELDRVSGALAYYTHELQQIDPDLQVVMAKPTTTVEGLRPGYYHIVRMRPGSFAYIKVIEGPDGEWRDLDSSIFDMAAEDDLWNDRVQADIRRRQRRAEDARQRDVERARQDRAREVDERIHSMANVSISVPRSI